MYAHSEELVLGNVRFKAFDIGGFTKFKEFHVN